MEESVLPAVAPLNQRVLSLARPQTPAPPHRHLPHGPVPQPAPAIVLRPLSEELGRLVDHQRRLAEIVIYSLDRTDIFNFEILQRAVSEQSESYTITQTLDTLK